MAASISLYVDEISPDKIKATVSSNLSVSYNLKTVMGIRYPFFFRSYQGPISDSLGEEINGVCIVPTGKFICMVVRKDDSRSMIFLDLVGRADLAERMAEKLNQVDLQEKFMQVYAEIMSHPERHKWFNLVVGYAGK